MASVAYGISGFADGFFRGREIKHAWQDRKDDKERQARLDKLTEAEAARAQERHDRQMRAYDRDDADWTRAREDDDFYRDLFADAAAEAGGGTGAGETTTSTQGGEPAVSPARGVAQELGIDPSIVVPRPQMDAAAQVMQRTMPAESLRPAQPRPGPTRAAAEKLPQAAPRPSGYNGGIRYLPDGTPVAPAPSRAIADELGLQGPAGVRYLPKPEAAAPSQADPRRAEFEARIAAEEERMRRGWATNPDLPARQREIAREALGIAPQPVAPATPPAPPAHAPLRSKVPAAAPATVKKVAADAVEQVNAAPAPVAEAAQAGIKAAGVAPGGKAGPAQYERAGAFALDHYMTVSAPKIIEGMLSRGDFDRAQKFMEFMDTVEAREGMKDWAAAAAAATLGDVERFGEHVIRAYNRAGYFPDGVELVEDQSGWTYDKAGNPAAARLVFRNTKTGQTYEQVYQGADDVLKLGLGLLEPSRAFEIYYERQSAAASAAMGARDKAEGARAAEEKQILSLAQDIVENSKGLDGRPTVSMEEAIGQAQRSVGAVREALTGGGGASTTAPPPVLYRPN
ncbi:hypothetical protein [Frigidibacter oleivorans]|uniref:hypothetical protein n=1 Tax=Frigidibacter oleivorans TaxID=2487129 RepID=UPI000F8C7C61|nr:hypothetical protein [Frigidibacter oleivorans]